VSSVSLPLSDSWTISISNTPITISGWSWEIKPGVISLHHVRLKQSLLDSLSVTSFQLWHRVSLPSIRIISSRRLPFLSTDLVNVLDQSLIRGKAAFAWKLPARVSRLSPWTTRIKIATFTLCLS
jgi:hypothetical protein